MITITKNETVVNIYGVTSALEMRLTSMSTNVEFAIPLYIASSSERFGLYVLVFDPEIQMNTGEIIEGVTHINAVPGKYIYKIANPGEEEITGIFYIRDEKIDKITYEQTNESKTYQG